jgi:hypothetical protein
MAQLTGKHTFRMAIRTEGKIDHAAPRCFECGETVCGCGIVITSHPASFDNEGNLYYSGDQVRECFVLHEGCAKTSGWLEQRIKCDWV